MNRQPAISVIGDLAVDYELHVGNEPTADEKIRLQSVHRSAGGTGGNAACAAAKLGAHVRLHSIVGNDADSRWLVSQTARDGVDVAAVQVVDGTAAQAFIVREGDTRRVYTHMKIMDQFRPVDAASLLRDDLVFVNYSPTACRQLLESTVADRIVVGVEAWMVDDLDDIDMLNRSRLIITNEAGWQSLIRRHDRAALTVDIIETRGAAGSTIHRSGRPQKLVPAYPVELIDATGAGDTFAGAILRYLAAGENLASAARLASIAAALTTTQPGARSAQPTYKQVLAVDKIWH